MRKVGLVLLLVVAIGVAAMGQTVVAPRSVGVFLFDNQTGATVTQLGIIFDKAVSFDKSSVIAIGGEEATLVAVSNNYAFINIVVVPGGTVQLMLTGEYADAKVTSAFWFE